MGWEYHERHRDRLGRFLSLGAEDQIHIRCTPGTHALIQARATARATDITGYILDLVKRDLMKNYPFPGDEKCTHGEN